MPAGWQICQPAGAPAVGTSARPRGDQPLQVTRALRVTRTRASPRRLGTIVAVRRDESMKALMFRITEQLASGRLVFKLEGRFSAAYVPELDGCWREAIERSHGLSIWIDLTDVDLVDVAGQEQLTRMHREGVRFLTRGPLMRELVREISEASGISRSEPVPAGEG